MRKGIEMSDLSLEEQLDFAKKFAFELNIRAVRAEKAYDKLFANLTKVADVKNQQGQPGNWDYDDYMRGLYNGIELAQSIMEEREPVYKSKDEQ